MAILKKYRGVYEGAEKIADLTEDKLTTNNNFVQKICGKSIGLDFKRVSVDLNFDLNLNQNDPDGEHKIRDIGSFGLYCETKKVGVLPSGSQSLVTVRYISKLYLKNNSEYSYIVFADDDYVRHWNVNGSLIFSSVDIKEGTGIPSGNDVPSVPKDLGTQFLYLCTITKQ